MPSLKPIHAALAIAVALGAASQSLAPASAQKFISRMDQGKKECEGKHGKFKQENPTSGASDTYTCTYEHKTEHCVASTGKCETKDMPGPKPAAAAPPAPAATGRMLLGLGHIGKDELKKVCAKNKDWIFNVENPSGDYSCTDLYDGITILCKKEKNNEKDCTEVHIPVHPH
jgi:hypothetical protein